MLGRTQVHLQDKTERIKQEGFILLLLSFDRIVFLKQTFCKSDLQSQMCMFRCIAAVQSMYVDKVEHIFPQGTIKLLFCIVLTLFLCSHRQPVTKNTFRQYRVLGKGGFGEVRSASVSMSP